MTGLLIFIGLILVILNVLSIKKQNKSFNGVLGNAIENIDDYDIKLGEIRREFSESIIELQREILTLRETIENSHMDHGKMIYNEEKIYDKDKINIEDKIYVEDENKSIIENTENINGSKIDDIKRLFSEGMSVSEISEILKLGKGEVLLIKDLYIK